MKVLITDHINSIPARLSMRIGVVTRGEDCVTIGEWAMSDSPRSVVPDGLSAKSVSEKKRPVLGVPPAPR